MTHNIGTKFAPRFTSNIDHFEVRGFDESRKMVLTKCFPKSGFEFEDEIEEEYYNAAFAVGDYILLHA